VWFTIPRDLEGTVRRGNGIGVDPEIDRQAPDRGKLISAYKLPSAIAISI
jgi:hypothetical protein